MFDEAVLNGSVLEGEWPSVGSGGHENPRFLEALPGGRHPVAQSARIEPEQGARLPVASPDAALEASRDRRPRGRPPRRGTRTPRSRSREARLRRSMSTSIESAPIAHHHHGRGGPRDEGRAHRPRLSVGLGDRLGPEAGQPTSAPRVPRLRWMASSPRSPLAVRLSDSSRGPDDKMANTIRIEPHPGRQGTQQADVPRRSPATSRPGPPATNGGHGDETLRPADPSAATAGAATDARVLAGGNPPPAVQGRGLGATGARRDGPAVRRRRCSPGGRPRSSS